MNIESYIKELLYRYECVVIPEFGGFISQRVPAEINHSTNEFYPPKKNILFNHHLTSNDGVLISYIAKAEKISYAEAQEKVSTFAYQLSESIKKHQEVSLENFGKFYEQNDKVLFLPQTQENYLTDSFGLSTFGVVSIAREAEKTVKAEPTEASDLEEKTPVIALPQNEEKAKKSTSKPYLKYAAVGLLALGIAGFVGTRKYLEDIQSHNLVEQQKANKLVEQEIQEATFVIQNPLPKVVFEIEKQVGKYHVVAGAFREKENAVKKVNQLKDQGFSPREIGVNNYGLHQVIYQSFETRAEAIRKLYEIKKTSNPEAWLLVKEL
ncbi:HU family DNA-binding protein [Mesonia sp. K7]|uniref:HU domain-containing protein n=1 Tax=Mesonia sp. K7 TaxID=2218606 RepID=UPI000DA784FC|nr:HU family DNA-binding protein [Mesonia sp. K7]PZD77413.1 SPOR domain-containing protein [Mesonia sp. K7]